MNNSLKFCEECGCKLHASDKFCTGCGFFLGRTDEAKHAIEQIPRAGAGSPVETTPLANLPVPPALKKVVQQPSQAAPLESAAPKASSMSAVYALVALIVVGGAGAFFMLKSGSSKESKKPTATEISQKQGDAKSESAGQAPKVTATGQMLVDAALGGDKEQFQVLLRQLQTRPPVATVDRKLARSLNDEALKAMKSGDYSAAIEALKKARDADAADAEISNNLGYALRMSGDFKASEVQLIGTIEQFPSRQQAWADLGETYSKLGKHSNAVASLIAAHTVSKNPEKFLEKLLKLADSSEDEAFKADLTEATQKISEAK